MENCIICDSNDFYSIGQHAISHYDYACSYCGKFRVDDLLNDRLRSDSFTKTDKEKISSFLHLKKLEGIKIVIISDSKNTFNDDLLEEINRKRVLDLFLDDILMQCKTGKING